MITSQYQRPRPPESSAVELLHLLMHCRYRDATDAKDKVYAALGALRSAYPIVLKPESADFFDIGSNYSTQTCGSDLCLEVRQELVRKSGSLDCPGVRPKTGENIPSWATDSSVLDRISSHSMQDSIDRARTAPADS